MGKIIKDFFTSLTNNNGIDMENKLRKKECRKLSNVYDTFGIRTNCNALAQLVVLVTLSSVASTYIF